MVTDDISTREISSGDKKTMILGMFSVDGILPCACVSGSGVPSGAVRLALSHSMRWGTDTSFFSKLFVRN